MNFTEELIKAALAVVGYYIFYRATLRQPRLTYFLSGFASCSMRGAGQPTIVWIYQITI